MKGKLLIICDGYGRRGTGGNSYRSAIKAAAHYCALYHFDLARTKPENIYNPAGKRIINVTATVKTMRGKLVWRCPHDPIRVSE